MADSVIKAIINYLLKSKDDNKLLPDDVPVRVNGINVVGHLLAVSVVPGNYDASLIPCVCLFPVPGER
jgi:hypothetical protein